MQQRRWKLDVKVAEINSYHSQARSKQRRQTHIHPNDSLTLVVRVFIVVIYGVCVTFIELCDVGLETQEKPLLQMLWSFVKERRFL